MVPLSQSDNVVIFGQCFENHRRKNDDEKKEKDRYISDTN